MIPPKMWIPDRIGALRERTAIRAPQQSSPHESSRTEATTLEASDHCTGTGFQRRRMGKDTQCRNKKEREEESWRLALRPTTVIQDII